MAAADYITSVLADSPNCLIECQGASGTLVDSSGNGNDIPTFTGGSISYHQAGPDGGSDFAVRLAGCHASRSSPMNTNTNGWSFDMWIKPVSGSTNQAIIENGTPGANGWGNLFGSLGDQRGIAHGVGFIGQDLVPLGTGTWKYIALEKESGGNWNYYTNGVPSPSNPGGSTGVSTPTGGFHLARDGADFYVAYVAVYPSAIGATRILAHYNAMVLGPPADPPSNTDPPVATGDVIVLSTVTTTDGTWDDATSFAYQWQDSADGSTGWSDISGETADSLVIDPGETGKYLRCVVTATGAGGDTDEPSNVLGPVMVYPSVRVSTISG